MSQPAQWVPAILDYMKKVRSNISTLSELKIWANTTVDMETEYNLLGNQVAPLMFDATSCL